MLRETETYRKMRASFLSKENFNRMLETAVGQLERAIDLEPGDPGLQIRDIKIRLDEKKTKVIRCLYFVHPVFGDPAPYWLYFWRDEIRRLDETAAAETLEKVLDELDWRQ